MTATPTPEAELARLTNLVNALVAETEDIERQADRARGEFVRLMVDLREAIEAKKAEMEEAMRKLDELIEEHSL